MPSLIHPGLGPPSLGRFVSPRSTVVVTAAPLTVPGLRLWLAADEIVGLSGGAAVSTWPDISGRGNDATQGTAGAQPSYQTGVVNGLPVVRFDGTADWMNLATADLLAATNAVGGISYFAAAKLSLTDAATRDFLSISTGTAANSARLKAGQRFVTTAGLWGMTARRLDADAAASIQDVADDTAWHILVAVVDYSTGVGNLYVDGQPVSSNYSLTTTGTTSATNALAAAVGARADGLGEFWPGDIAELIAYVGATAVSAVDRATITNYLLAKYAIPAAPTRTGQVGTALHPGRGPSQFARFWSPLRTTDIPAPSGESHAGAAAGEQRTDGTTAAQKQALGAPQGGTRASGQSLGVKGAAGAASGQQHTSDVAADIKQAIGAAQGQQHSSGTTAIRKQATAAAAGEQHAVGATVGVKAARGAVSGPVRPAGLSVATPPTPPAVPGHGTATALATGGTAIAATTGGSVYADQPGGTATTGGTPGTVQVLDTQGEVTIG